MTVEKTLQWGIYVTVVMKVMETRSFTEQEVVRY